MELQKNQYSLVGAGGQVLQLHFQGQVNMDESRKSLRVASARIQPGCYF